MRTDWGTFRVATPQLATAEHGIGAAIRAHNAVVDGPDCLKLRPSTKVTRVTIDIAGWPTGVVVKELRAPVRRRLGHMIGVPSRFRNDFSVVDHLASLGIKTPEVLAAQRRPRGQSEYQLTRFFGEATTVSATLWGESEKLEDANARARMITSLGEWVRVLHDHGVWQRDLKLNNVMVTGDHEFVLLDFTDLRFFPEGLSPDRRIRNLGQVLDVPRLLEDEICEPLLAAYAGGKRVGDELRAGVEAAIEARRRHREEVDGYRYVNGK